MADRSLTPDEMGPTGSADTIERSPAGGSVPPPPRPSDPPAVRRHRDPASATLAIGVGIVATILGLIVLAWTVLFVTKGRFLKPTFEKYASRFSERQVKVAGDFQFYFDPLDVKFLAEGLTVSNPAWATRKNFVEAGKIDTRIATLPLITGKQRVNWLELVQGHVDLEWDKTQTRNTWTFGDPNAKGKPFEMPVIRRAIMAGSTVRYRDPKMALDTTIRFETIKAQDTRFANAVRFSGDGTMRGTPFTLGGALLSPNETLAGGKNRFEFHANAVDTRVDVTGALNGMTELEGADLNARMRGHNLANLFELFGLTTPDTRSYRIASHITKAGDEYRFTRMSGFYGNSDIGGSMTVALRDRMKLTADLRSKLVDMVDIGPFIGYNPDALATKGAVAAVAQTGDHPRLLPDAPLRIDMIKNFDAHVVYKVEDIRQPFVPISNIDLTFDLDRSLMKLSPLNFDMAGGHVDSDISINARVPAVVTEYDIRMSPTPLGKLFARFGVSDSGTTGTIKARVQMKGTGDTLRESLASSNGRIAVILPRGTFWTSYAQLSEFDVGVFIQKMFEDKLKEPVQVNCGLIAFTVRDGVAAADPILIDTTKNVMTAKGGFSFKDESMNIAFRADGKKFSLFSGQSPVGINGYFAAPGYSIVSPQLIARGAAGVGLLAAVNPIAGLLAFVDPGDAKSAQCGPVLAGASAAAQRTSKGQPREDVGSRAENRGKAATDDKKEKKVLGIF